jgi:hypothetical protein
MSTFVHLRHRANERGETKVYVRKMKSHYHLRFSLVLIIAASLFAPSAALAKEPGKAKPPVEFSASLGTPGKFEAFRTPFKVKITGTRDQGCVFHASIICVASTVSVSLLVFGASLPKKGKTINLTYTPGPTTNPESIALIKGWWFALVANQPRTSTSTVEDGSLELKVQNVAIPTTRALSKSQITLTVSGGKCYGGCRGTGTIDSSGNWTWHWTDQGQSNHQGSFDQTFTQTLFGLLTNGSLTEIHALPDTESGCPSRRDGKDITYGFVVGDVALGVDNCHIKLSAHPLLAATNQALDAMLTQSEFRFRMPPAPAS